MALIKTENTADGISNLVMFCILIYILTTNPKWFYNHFTKNLESSVPYEPYQVFTCIGLSYFMFEMIYNHQYDYYEWNKVISSHHWVASFVSLFAMNRICLPMCTFWGINATILSFPSCFFIAWVFSKYSYLYPSETRSFARYIHIYHTVLSVVNVTGTVYICANAIMKETIPVEYIGLFACVAVVWIYDDLNTIQWLEMLSYHQYQDLQFYKKHKN